MTTILIACLLCFIAGLCIGTRCARSRRVEPRYWVQVEGSDADEIARYCAKGQVDDTATLTL